jgi:peroxiredoxin
VALSHVEKMYRELGTKGLMVATVSTDRVDTAKTYATYNKLASPYLVDHRDKDPMGEVSTRWHRWKGEYIVDSTGTIVENFESPATLKKVRATLARLGIE